LKINLFVFIAELAAALYSGSLAMLSDSLDLSIHILAPFLAYISEFQFLSIPAEKIKKVASLMNISLFFLLAAIIAKEAWDRLSDPPDITIGLFFIIVAFAGLAANIYNAKLLHRIPGHSCEQNIKPLFWHMVFDAAGSVIVIIGAITMYFSKIYIVDPILSIFIAGLMVLAAIKMLRTNEGHS
jgi:cobalt-zinc-cadmium efflux system protein